MEAFVQLEQWLIDGEKPADVTDRCYDAGYKLLAEGDDVWSGVLTADANDDGACVAPYPIHSGSRM